MISSGVLNSTSLCHSLVRYTFMQLILPIITIVIFTGYAVILLYYRRSWLSIPAFHIPQKQTNLPDSETFVTIIIPARNEERCIGACLESVLSQRYPKKLLEVIVVDDHSSDNTVSIIQNFRTGNIKLLSLKDHLSNETLNSYKKKAIEIAVNAAAGELIITTDADCIMPPNWLQTMTAFYETYRPAFIAAPVTYLPFNKEDGPGIKFLKIFQLLDFMSLQGITGASVYKKFHTMCNGANLAYEKKVFHEVGGFKGIDNIASGDDMLLMHKIYQAYPERVLFLKSRDAIVRTRPMDTFKDFINQRIRWASKADKYNDKRIFPVLLLVYILNAWIMALAIIVLFNSSMGYWLIAVILAKTIIELFFLYPVSVFFEQQKLLWWFPIAQPFHIIYTVIAGWLGRFGTYHWKERKVK